jgi:hypothetical protein
VERGEERRGEERRGERRGEKHTTIVLALLLPSVAYGVSALGGSAGTGTDATALVVVRVSPIAMVGRLLLSFPSSSVSDNPSEAGCAPTAYTHICYIQYRRCYQFDVIAYLYCRFVPHEHSPPPMKQMHPYYHLPSRVFLQLLYHLLDSTVEQPLVFYFVQCH